MMRKQVGLLTFAMIVGLIGALPHAYADEMPSGNDHERQGQDWQFHVGAGFEYEPDYQGSNDYRTRFLPDVSVTWKDRVTLSVDELTADILHAPNYSFGLGIGYDLGRKESANTALKGLGKIEGSLQGIAYGSYSYEFVELSAIYEQDISDGSKGATLALAADVLFPLSENLLLVFGPDVTWASGDYMQSRFGINDRQSAASVYSKYNAGAGIKDAGAHVHVNYMLTEHISLDTLLQYTQLVGDAADSPIVQSEGQFYGAMTLGYTF